jgi:hypothetical protein
MTDRVHKALDGELPPEQLRPDELKSYHEHQRAIRSALEPLRELPPIDVASSVMTRIGGRPTRETVFGRFARWVWSPTPVTLAFRPAYALAAALALVTIGFLTLTGREPVAPADMAVAKRPVRVMVQFRLGDSAAQSVSLVGDFTGWRPEIELRQVAPGVWVYEVPLEPGVYNYGFLVDGKIWRPDPLAPQVSDGFGGANSRLTVLAPEAAS